jgi:GTPase SAR1 family protein
MADQDRDRFQKEIEVEVQKIDASFQKISVKVPQDAKADFDNLRQAVKGLVERYKNQPTQLPADPNNPQASNPMAPGGQPQPK